MKQMYPSLEESLVLNIEGYDIDINTIIKNYGFFTRKFGAYAYLIGITGINMIRAKNILDPIYFYHMKKAESIRISEDYIACKNRNFHI